MAANTNHAFGYGDDPWTEEATRKVKEQFTHPCEPLFVFNGTGSNTMALQLMTRPYHVIFCADTAHIAVDECGAPSKATGLLSGRSSKVFCKCILLQSFTDHDQYILSLPDRVHLNFILRRI